MGWEILEKWGNDAERVERMSGGVANDVWRVRIGGKTYVARLGKRSDADLEWETNLLKYLSLHRLVVPVPLPTLDGRLFCNGLVVMEHLEGHAPKTKNDWELVASTLARLHELTRKWPQRPGWRSSSDLMQCVKGTKIDLTKMPAEGVRRCRAAWSHLQERETCVVHGDTNPGNILIKDNIVALIDWDESHVDVPDFDLVLPENAGNLGDGAFEIAVQASAAWEAAVCWGDDYAIKRLAEVNPV